MGLRITLLTMVLVMLNIKGCVNKETETIVGPPGPAGKACSVLQGDGFALIECEDSSAIVRDGEDSTPITWVDPCPELPATFPELLLLQDGVYYAVYASGNKIHLTALMDGVQYRTTDGRNCRFMVEDL